MSGLGQTLTLQLSIRRKRSSYVTTWCYSLALKNSAATGHNRPCRIPRPDSPIAARNHLRAGPRLQCIFLGPACTSVARLRKTASRITQPVLARVVAGIRLTASEHLPGFWKGWRARHSRQWWSPVVVARPRVTTRPSGWRWPALLPREAQHTLGLPPRVSAAWPGFS